MDDLKDNTSAIIALQEEVTRKVRRKRALEKIDEVFSTEEIEALYEQLKPYPVNLDHSACCTTSDPYKKCRGCIMFGEEREMHATIPYCGLVDDFWEGVKRCEEPGECYHKTGGGEIRRYILSKTQTRHAMIETEENEK